ncbi:MAG: hypothetical protein H5T64_03735 [Chloroflexi bacterium]|nr:hypothetical protein [Chloroflexota bacterium]
MEEQEFTEEEFTAELVAAAKDYMAFREQEAAGLRPLTADQLPADLKEAMGLDIFPEDIQNDILALSQKLADYMLSLAEESGEEATPWGRSFINCAADMPSRAIHRDAMRNATTVWRYSKGPLKPVRLPGSLAAYGGTLIGGAAGHMYGCVKGSFRR